MPIVTPKAVHIIRVREDRWRSHEWQALHDDRIMTGAEIAALVAQNQEGRING